jgi:hypothetical protein
MAYIKLFAAGAALALCLAFWWMVVTVVWNIFN